MCERTNNYNIIKDKEKVRAICVMGSVVMIDIDSIIVNSTSQATFEFNQRYGCNFNYQDTDEWKIFIKWGEEIGLSDKEASKFSEWVWHDPVVLSRCPPIIGAKPLVYKLLNKGVDVHLLTARKHFLENMTKVWVKKWLPRVDLSKIHHEEDKSRIINKFEAAALIDDAQHNIKVILEDTQAYGILVPFGKTVVTLPEHERLIIFSRGIQNQNLWPLYDAI